MFCAILKILPVFVFVLPGVMCLAMVQQGAPVFGGEAPKSAADAYAFMLTHMLPWGLKGLVIAAMLAAAMQTCSAALNSTATLFAYDVVKRYRTRTSDRQLVVIGKIATAVGTVIAIASSPLFGHKDTIFQALTDLICYAAPPITAVFLFGVFWRRATGRAAFAAMVFGGAAGATVFFLELFKTHTGWMHVVAWHSQCTGLTLNSMIASFYIFALCGAIIVAASLIRPQPLKEEAKTLVWEDWREPLRGQARGRALGNYRVLSAVVFLTFVTLYIIFRLNH